MKLRSEETSSAISVGEYGESEVMSLFSVEKLETSKERREQQLIEYREKAEKWWKEENKRRKDFTGKGLYSPSSPVFPGSDILTSDILSILASGEYYEKPYEQEYLAQLAELSPPLKSNIIAYAGNTVGGEITYRPSKKRKLYNFTPEEMDEYHIQGRKLLMWLDSITEVGKRFCEVAEEHVAGKKRVGEGYLEVLRTAKGGIAQVKFVSAQHVYILKDKPGYVWTKNGDKKYYKKFGDKTVYNRYTFEVGAGNFQDSATELIPYKETSGISSIYGVPNWTPNIPSILGSRYADERNVNFFLNDAPQPLDAEILTPKGWVTMGELSVGDLVMGKDGKPHKILEVKPQGVKDVYRVEFMDGTSTECTLGHLWTVTNDENTVQTKSLYELVQEPDLQTWKIPLIDPVEPKNPEKLEFSPYILGNLGVMPKNCLSLSKEDRIKFLQGFCDSSATIYATEISFDVTDFFIKIQNGLKDLISSLGGVYTDNSEISRKLVISSLPKDIIPFTGPRREFYINCCKMNSSRWRAFKSVTYSQTVETQCIRTDAEDSLYITDEYIVTHNTPRLVVLISGGRVDSATEEKAKEFFRKGKGREHFGRALILAVSGKNTLAGTRVPTVKLEPLGLGKEDDASFMKYREVTANSIREAFQQALIFLGSTGDSNRASSYTLRDMTVEGTYSREAKNYGHLTNETLVPEFAKENKIKDLLVEIEFVIPRTMSEKDYLEHMLSEVSVGAVTINDYRTANGMNRIERWFADLPAKMWVPAMQMSELSPELVASLTGFDEFKPDNSEEGKKDDPATKSLMGIRKLLLALTSAPAKELSEETLDYMDKYFSKKWKEKLDE